MADDALQATAPVREPLPAGKRGRRSKVDRQLDAVAWRVLDDLLRPDGAFAGLAPAGLAQLIHLRLDEEARKLGVAPERLAAAFDHATRELTGSPALAAGASGEPSTSGANEQRWNELPKPRPSRHGKRPPNEQSTPPESDEPGLPPTSI